MIEKFTSEWPQIEAQLLAKYTQEAPSSYAAIFSDLIEALPEQVYGEQPDSERIHVINDGDYQGTLLFIVAAEGYQPYKYWSCFVSYGSCSGCDTFEAIQSDHSYDEVTDEAAKDYVQLALHMLQGLREVG